MKLLNKIVLASVLLSLGVIFGLYLNFNFFNQKKIEDATVVLEKIKTVTKLITVEGSVSEIYKYKDYYSYDFSPFRKKALIRVNAKVSAGYDFEKMQINIRPDKKLIEINNFPAAEILSIDHDLDYYDLTEGVFNSFETSDLNELNDKAKEKIALAAQKSDLLKKAEDQKNDLLEMLKIMIQGSGYELKVSKSNNLPLD
jgi:hypothetical protein